MSKVSVSLSGNDGVFTSNQYDEFVGENLNAVYQDAGLGAANYAQPSGYKVPGAPNTNIVSPNLVTIGKTLDVVVNEQMRANSGDAQSTSLLFARYADNRGAGNDWENVQAVYASDDIESIVVLGNSESSAQLMLGDFDVNIPASATLLGIEVEVDRRVLQGSVVSDALSSMTCEFTAASSDYTSDTYLKASGFPAFTYNAGGAYWAHNSTLSNFGTNLLPVGDDAGWVTTAGQPTSITLDWNVLVGSSIDVDGGNVRLYVYPFGSSTPTLRKTISPLNIVRGTTQQITIDSIGWVAGDTFAGFGFRGDTNDEGIYDMRISNVVFNS